MNEESKFGTVAERVRERIVNAPVEDYIKQEGLKELDKLVAVHKASMLELATVQAEEKAVEETLSEPDKSWQRQQIVSELLRQPTLMFDAYTGQHVVEQAKVIEAYLHGE